MRSSCHGVEYKALLVVVSLPTDPEMYRWESPQRQTGQTERLGNRYGRRTRLADPVSGRIMMH